MRRWAIIGFAISVVALLYLLAWCWDGEMRRLFVAQFAPGFRWHLPGHIRVATVTFMLLNLPSTVIATVVVTTLMASWAPVSRAVAYFAIWWVLTPVWWWCLGMLGRKGRSPKAAGTD